MQEPRNGSFHNTLGAAYYGAGDWNAAIKSLEKSMKLQGPTSWDWFFLAMAQYRLGRKEEALASYQRAMQWLEKNSQSLSPNENQELSRFQAEAAELLEGKVKNKRPMNTDQHK
jgi:tetratricopeptide (TPR) repeat protein